MPGVEPVCALNAPGLSTGPCVQTGAPPAVHGLLPQTWKQGPGAGGTARWRRDTRSRIASHPSLEPSQQSPPQALRSHSHKVEPLASPQPLASPRLPASLPERPSLGTVSAPRTPAETGRSLCPSEAPGYNSCSVSTCCISRHVDRKQGSLWVCPSSDWRIVYVCMNLDQRTGPI